MKEIELTSDLVIILKNGNKVTADEIEYACSPYIDRTKDNDRDDDDSDGLTFAFELKKKSKDDFPIILHHDLRLRPKFIPKGCFDVLDAKNLFGMSMEEVNAYIKIGLANEGQLSSYQRSLRK